MTYLDNLVSQTSTLSMYQIQHGLISFLKDKHNTLADVEQFQTHINIYIPNYAGEQEDKDDLGSKILTKFKSIIKKLEMESEVEFTISKTPFGYTIFFDEENPKVALVEVLKDYDRHTCVLCGEHFKGEGKQAEYISENRHDLVCNECFTEYIQPIKEKYSKRTTLLEVDKDDNSLDDITDDISNVILDDKFEWFFNVLDETGEPIKTDIPSLDEAIQVLLEEDGVFLIGNPYVDPNPDNPDSQLVFADNPGPVIIYDGEKATKEKDEEDFDQEDDEDDEDGFEDLGEDDEEATDEELEELKELERELDGR